MASPLKKVSKEPPTENQVEWLVSGVFIEERRKKAGKLAWFLFKERQQFPKGSEAYNSLTRSIHKSIEVIGEP